MERIEPEDFVAEAGQRSQFLVDLYGMEGPECSNHLLPSVFYRRPELSVSSFLNQGDGAGRRITVSVSVKTEHGPSAPGYRAWLRLRCSPPGIMSAGRPTTWRPCSAPSTTMQPG